MKRICNRVFNLILTTVYFTVTVSTNPALADESPNIEQGTGLVSALKSAASEGFFVNAEQYNRVIQSLNKYQTRDFSANPLTEDEMLEIGAIVAELRNSIPIWIERLIRSGKDLEERGDITFENPQWDELRAECIHIGSPTDAKTPLQEFVDELEKIKKGQAVSWKPVGEYLQRDNRDCQRLLRNIVVQVQQAKEQIEQELIALNSKIKQKEEECRALSDDDAQQCNDELDELYDELEDKTETVKRMQEFEDKGKKNMALLGALAIIAGVVIAVYGFPQLGASIAAWGGKTLEDNQDTKVTRPVEEVHITGRKRVLSEEGVATPADRAALRSELKDKGFTVVEVDDPTHEGVAYEVLRSETEIRIYLVKSKKLIALIDGGNTDVSPNTRQVNAPTSISDIRIVGDIFVEDNRLKLDIRAIGPDGQPITVSITEKSVGEGSYSLTVEE